MRKVLEGSLSGSFAKKQIMRKLFSFAVATITLSLVAVAVAVAIAVVVAVVKATRSHLRLQV